MRNYYKEVSKYLIDNDRAEEIKVVRDYFSPMEDEKICIKYGITMNDLKALLLEISILFM